MSRRVVRPAALAAAAAAAPVALAQAGGSGRFLFIPYGWAWFLGGLAVVAFVFAAIGFVYGRLTRPGRARRYAGTAVKHVFIWTAILFTLYPVIYLLAVSFNRNNALATIPPRVGNLLVRSGVLPDPSALSLIQYQRVLGQTHLYGYQWVALALFGVSVVGVALFSLIARGGKGPALAGRLRSVSIVGLLIGVGVLMVSISADQFYTLAPDGSHLRSSSGSMMVLYIRNTLLVSTLTGLFAVAISTTAGYAFARLRFEGRYGTLLAFVFIQMFPSFMAIVAIFYLMNYLGLLNTYAGLILAYSGGAIAFSSWIFKGYLESISSSLEEAAMVDGATRFGAFLRVIVPVSVPMLLFIFLLQFIGTYSEFILANVLLTSNDMWTVGLGLRALTSNALATQWGTLAASAVLGSLPILVIFYSFQNAFTSQYTAGGVKG